MRRLALVFGLMLSACGAEVATPAFHTDANPPTLAEWGALASDGKTLSLGEGVTPYTLQQPLFTDYAHKLRTVWVPEGSAPYAEGAALDFPVGTVITKTFYYPTEGAGIRKTPDLQPVNASRPLDLAENRLIETRVLVRRDVGWKPVSYVWNAEQTEATLKRTGAVVPLSLAGQDFAYLVPNENQCAACHADNATTEVIRPLGPRPAQLAGSYDYGHGPEAQLARWEAEGLVESVPEAAPAWPAFADLSAPLDTRARAYLAANCAHCHNPVGPADTSGLDLTVDAATPVALGTCKLPIAAGSGTGGHRYGIHPGRPNESILAYRMASTDPGAMMPELGRALSHAEGVALVTDWIAAMEGGCES